MDALPASDRQARAALPPNAEGRNSDLWELDATAIAALVRRRELSAAEAAETALTRIERLDTSINAHTEVLVEAARRQAHELDKRLARERGSVGPMCGVPFSVKDITWVRGSRATQGSRALQSFVAPENARVVERMRDADAILIGKTNNPEFCFRGVTDNELYGLTRNPWDLDRTPGGSSGGAGAAVAARMTPIALGSDGGGSIRIPAAFCGVCGLKPTTGRIPSGPGFRGWRTLTTDGPIARSVRDLRLCLQVLGNRDGDRSAWRRERAMNRTGTEPTRSEVQAGRPLAYSVDLGFAPVDPGVRSCFVEAIERLRARGWRLEPAAPSTGDPTELWNRIALIEGYAANRTLLSERRDLIGADAAALIEAGAEYSAADYLDALEEREAYAAVWDAYFERYEALLLPTMQLTAMPVGLLSPPTIDGRPIDPFFDDWCSFCLPANLTGQPAVSVPCGLDRAGLPVGLEVIAPRWHDEVVLEIAGACQECTPASEFNPSQRVAGQPARRFREETESACL